VKTAKRKYSRSLVVGCVLVGFIALMALLSIFWTPYSVNDTTGTRLGPLSSQHWLGTDKLGRDLLSRVMIGARIAIAVGFSSVLIGAIVGVSLGLLAGFAQRWVDESFSAMFDILIAFPTLLLAMLVVAARGLVCLQSWQD
jgi:peptide/nickel transport system permease protein